MVDFLKFIVGWCGNARNFLSATQKLAVFPRKILDNLKHRVYTEPAFRVNKESETYRKLRFLQIYNHVHAHGITLTGWFCVTKSKVKTKRF